MSIYLRRREFIAGLGGAAVAWPLAARAQQGNRVRRIGVLMQGDENAPEQKRSYSAFTQALAALGWIDGRNVRMDPRLWFGDGTDRTRALAQELVGSQPDIIVTRGNAATAARTAGDADDPDRVRECGRSGRQRHLRASYPDSVRYSIQLRATVTFVGRPAQQLLFTGMVGPYGGGVKKALRAIVEAALCHLPVSRTICAERNTLKAERDTLKAERDTLKAYRDWLGSAAAVDFKAPDREAGTGFAGTRHQLESLIPPLRTADERATLPIPPFEMRQLVGPTDEPAFENLSGAPILNVPEARFDSVLDFGCGCGRLARQMLQQRPRPHRYVGFDLHAGMIRWCRNNLEPHAPGFTFLHHDVYNPSFNPGVGKPPLLPMPAEDSSCSLLIALSVFTHTTQAHAEYYLREAARVMRPDGELAASFFLFEKRFFPMMHDFNNVLYVTIEDPTGAVIFDREWLETSLGALGLGVVRAEPPDVRGFQWLLHIRRLSAGEPIVPLPEDRAPFGRMPPPICAKHPSTIGS
jgi:SAM-dependent methyltransferase